MHVWSEQIKDTPKKMKISRLLITRLLVNLFTYETEMYFIHQRR
jgi:hypothetical protein